MNHSVEAGASSAAIQAHYDVGNEFYELWLDPTLTYSCALWCGKNDTLEAAQRRKLEFISNLAVNSGARRVLDVGCGWGGLLIQLMSHGVTEAIGLTLSRSQYEYVNGLHVPGVSVCLESWRDHQPRDLYDAIVSVGAFEHFAKIGLSRTERLQAYREFFEKCHELTRADAPLILQVIARGPSPDTSAGTRFFAEVFPESDCPPLPDILEAAEGLFELELLRNDRGDYTRTLAAWLRQLKANQSAAIRIVGAELVEKYKAYLGLSSIAFHKRNRILVRSAWRRIS